MIAMERLSLDEIAAGSLIAAHHVHRYEVAAPLVAGRRVIDLCCGTGYGSFILARSAKQVIGVDLDEAAIAEARRGEQAHNVAFVVDDALAYLQKLEPDSVDAVVCLEGIEHVPNPDAVTDALSRLTSHGARLIVSFPNSRAFGEENEFHVTDFGYEEILEMLGRFEDPILLRQYLAEGSLVVGPETAAASDELIGKVADIERLEPEWANHYMAIVGAEDSEVEAAVAHLRLASNPNYNSYMRALAVANDALYRTNRRLAQAARGGVADAAAATLLARADAARVQATVREEAVRDRDEWQKRAFEAERQVAEARRAFDEVRLSRSWRLTSPLRAVAARGRGAGEPHGER